MWAAGLTGWAADVDPVEAELERAEEQGEVEAVAETIG